MVPGANYYPQYPMAQGYYPAGHYAPGYAGYPYYSAYQGLSMMQGGYYPPQMPPQHVYYAGPVHHHHYDGGNSTLSQAMQMSNHPAVLPMPVSMQDVDPISNVSQSTSSTPQSAIPMHDDPAPIKIENPAPSFAPVEKETVAMEVDSAPIVQPANSIHSSDDVIMTSGFPSSSNNPAAMQNSNSSLQSAQDKTNAPVPMQDVVATKRRDRPAKKKPKEQISINLAEFKLICASIRPKPEDKGKHSFKNALQKLAVSQVETRYPNNTIIKEDAFVKSGGDHLGILIHSDAIMMQLRVKPTALTIMHYDNVKKNIITIRQADDEEKAGQISNGVTTQRYANTGWTQEQIDLVEKLFLDELGVQVVFQSSANENYLDANNRLCNDSLATILGANPNKRLSTAELPNLFAAHRHKPFHARIEQAIYKHAITSQGVHIQYLSHQGLDGKSYNLELRCGVLNKMVKPQDTENRTSWIFRSHKNGLPKEVIAGRDPFYYQDGAPPLYTWKLYQGKHPVLAAWSTPDVVIQKNGIIARNTGQLELKDINGGVSKNGIPARETLRIFLLYFKFLGCQAGMLSDAAKFKNTHTPNQPAPQGCEDIYQLADQTAEVHAGLFTFLTKGKSFYQDLFASIDPEVKVELMEGTLDTVSDGVYTQDPRMIDAALKTLPNYTLELYWRLLKEQKEQSITWVMKENNNLINELCENPQIAAAMAKWDVARDALFIDDAMVDAISVIKEKNKEEKDQTTYLLCERFEKYKQAEKRIKFPRIIHALAVQQKMAKFQEAKHLDSSNPFAGSKLTLVDLALAVKKSSALNSKKGVPTHDYLALDHILTDGVVTNEPVTADAKDIPPNTLAELRHCISELTGNAMFWRFSCPQPVLDYKNEDAASVVMQVDAGSSSSSSSNSNIGKASTLKPARQRLFSAKRSRAESAGSQSLSSAGDEKNAETESAAKRPRLDVNVPSVEAKLQEEKLVQFTKLLETPGVLHCALMDVIKGAEVLKSLTPEKYAEWAKLHLTKYQAILMGIDVCLTGARKMLELDPDQLTEHQKVFDRVVKYGEFFAPHLRPNSMMSTQAMKIFDMASSGSNSSNSGASNSHSPKG